MPSLHENTNESADASNGGTTNDNQPCTNVTAQTEVLESNGNGMDSGVDTGTADDDATAAPDDDKKKLEQTIDKASLENAFYFLVAMSIGLTNSEGAALFDNSNYLC